MLNSVLDFFFPRYCHVCGNRLLKEEQALCIHCNVELPRTFHWDMPYDNDLAKRFWGKIPIEKAVSYIFYHAHTDTAQLVYAFKYNKEPYTATTLGEMMAKEIGRSFFDDIDCIIPVPLNKKKLRQRGYNQSERLAQGIRHIFDIPIVDNSVIRTANTITQTQLDITERQENANGIFKLTAKAEKLQNSHCLIIDDIITTGATITSCATEILKISGTRVSILSFGSASQTL